MRTKLNRYGYVIKKASMTAVERKTLKKELTLMPVVKGNIQPEPIKLYVNTEEDYGIPRYYGIERYGKPKRDILAEIRYEKLGLKMHIPLRDYQQVIVDSVINNIRNDGGGIITMPCGRGKTNVAIWIMCQLNVRTLIVVHKGDLDDQFVERLRETTNVDDVTKIGILGKGLRDCNHKIVVAFIQTISKDNFDKEYLKGFGLVIYDEVHHMGSRCFSKALKYISSKYTLGITATPIRLDEMFVIVHNYIGPQLYFEDDAKNENVNVCIIKYIITDKKEKKLAEDKFMRNGDINGGKMITNLCLITSRTLYVFDLLCKLQKHCMKTKQCYRKIIILSERNFQLDILYELFSKTKLKIGYYIGDMNKEDLKISKQADIILGSYMMANEGLDIPDLDTLVFMTPKVSIKQPVGRITRKEKITDYLFMPLIIDIVDENGIHQGKLRKRKDYYYKNAYNVHVCKENVLETLLLASDNAIEHKHTQRKISINLEEPMFLE